MKNYRVEHLVNGIWTKCFTMLARSRRSLMAEFELSGKLRRVRRTHYLD